MGYVSSWPADAGKRKTWTIPYCRECARQVVADHCASEASILAIRFMAIGILFFGLLAFVLRLRG